MAGSDVDFSNNNICLLVVQHKHLEGPSEALKVVFVFPVVYTGPAVAFVIALESNRGQPASKLMDAELTTRFRSRAGLMQIDFK